MHSWGSYSGRFPGSNGERPYKEEMDQLPGARHWSAGEIDGAKRNAYAGYPRQGLGASAPHDPFIMQPHSVSNDKPHEPSLDGALNSAVSNHPNGLFAQNTLATSSYSRGANWETLRGRFVPGVTYDVFHSDFQVKVPAMSEATRKKNKQILMSRRKIRGASDAQAPKMEGVEAIIKPPEWTASGRSRLSAVNLGLGALALSLAASALG